jgi:uncharacterized membrane protein
MSRGRSRRRPREAESPTPIAVRPARLDAVDAARGSAVCLMIAYHFCFDLRHFGWLAADFEHEVFWLAARAAILSSFLALVGVSLVLADRGGSSPARFWRRQASVAACAGAVSLGSYLVFRQSFIYFGVLHCVFVTSLLARPVVRHPRSALVLGLAAVAAGNALSHPAFDHVALSFVGLRTVKPQTEDYVPLLPWAGVALLGVAAGERWLTPQSVTRLAALRPPRLLAALGRHSLAAYMAHQPVLLAVLWLVARGVSPG